MLRVCAFLVVLASVAFAADTPPDRKPADTAPAPATQSAPACECGGPGQCCGQAAAADAPRAEPRQAGCGCGRAKANAERR